MIKDIAEDTSTWGLIGTARRSCPRDDGENAEDDPESSDTEDDACNSYVNPQKLKRQGATEQ